MTLNLKKPKNLIERSTMCNDSEISQKPNPPMKFIEAQFTIHLDSHVGPYKGGTNEL